MTSQIQLRGHHISNLAHEYLKSQGLVPVYPDAEVMHRARQIEDYGEEFSKRSRGFYESLLSNPEAKVEIVKGIDSLCGMDCKRRNSNNSNCEQNIAGDEDEKTLQEYRIKVGAKPTIANLARMFERYYERTGFWSPKDKIMQELLRKHFQRREK